MRKFVEAQTTRPVVECWPEVEKEQTSPYGRYWYRAIACFLLSGRILAKSDGLPNMTDVNRLGKEANFNQYFIEQIGTWLVAMKVIEPDHQRGYVAGPNLVHFWALDEKRLPAISRQAFLRLFGSQMGHPFWHPHEPEDLCLIEFLSLFFMSFKGLAIVESELGGVIDEFIRLPEDDLIEWARRLKIAKDRVDVAAWKKTFQLRGKKALITSLYLAEWAYYSKLKAKDPESFFASPNGLAMLGLGPSLPAPVFATTFVVQPDLSVFAGAGLPWETLVPLFRHATIKRIDQVYEFRLDRKRLAESPSGSEPGKELREAFRDLEPLPSTVADLLATKSKVGGKLAIRGCSALVKPESDEVLEAIRQHPKLKGYIEPGAPPGYLLIKIRSDPNGFVKRCKELGFDVEAL
ncbi:hypothetical protein [Singulisphaera sp. PoT]|uniref:hypothetical protein n=1 Tax=Singulisphaera sp. PoT TaxID=3411797 RepID=UPI003BF4D94F